jgi:ubiquinone/menaquinone biosynthesis C-methylase UbiE
MPSSAAARVEARREPIELTSFAEKLCMAVTNQFIKGPLRRLNIRENAPGQRFDNIENYVADRVSNVNAYESLFAPFVSFEGKTVLELGCSSGYLINAFRERQKFQPIGADISAEILAEARKKYPDLKWVQTTPKSIPVADSSCDIVYTVDTIEHLSEPDVIFRDVYRILKPGGTFLIHFGPWFGSDGAHLDDIIPFPWPHVFFSMDTLLKVAAHIYDSPDHTPACYWIDQTTGKVKPNPYLDREKWRLFLNNITVRQFKRLLKEQQFETVHFEHIGFSGKTFRFGKALSGLAHAPVLNEFFTRAIFCVLRKPL